jgi:hypothetical protein
MRLGAGQELGNYIRKSVQILIHVLDEMEEAMRENGWNTHLRNPST